MFQLGNPPKNCRPEIIKNNSVVSKDALGALAKIEACSARLREERNLLLHRGRSIDIPKLLNSEVLGKLKLFYSAQGLSRDYAGPPLLAFAMKKEKRTVKSTLKRYVQEAEDSTKLLFDCLRDTYGERKTSIPE